MNVINPKSNTIQNVAKKYDLVIYHGPCSDGVSALWCANQYLNEIEYKFESIQCRAGSDPDGDFDDKRILFVDLCPSLKFIIDKCKIAKKLTILDHHKSAIDMYHENASKLESIDNLEIEEEKEKKNRKNEALLGYFYLIIFLFIVGLFLYQYLKIFI